MIDFLSINYYLLLNSQKVAISKKYLNAGVTMLNLNQKFSSKSRRCHASAIKIVVFS